MERTRKLSALLGLAATIATAGAASAQQVNISGATLFANFFTAQASTNDFIDVDNDGISGQAQTGIENLAGSSWDVIYRGVGSGNGWAEMRDSQLARLAGNPYPSLVGLPAGTPSDLGVYNGVEYYVGSDTPPEKASYNPANTGGSPVQQTSIDIGVMDVPTVQFVQQVGVGSPTKTPGSAGYGTNGYKTALGKSQTLKDLGNSSLNATPLNTNTSSPDAYTVFDTPVAWVAIGAIANPGTGVTEATYEELRYMAATGRMPNGENLVSVVRDAGSGTRNGYMNSIGLDPSWGRGEGYSTKNDNDADLNGDTFSENDILGPDFLPDQKAGSSRMEDTVTNSRLAMGHTGLFGSSRAGADSLSDKYDVLSVKKDGATSYVTPSVTSLIDNDDINTGYQIGGVETFATVGDPSNGAGNPAMHNSNAEAYIDNIIGSLGNFINNGNLGSADFGMPAEYLVTNFSLPQSVSALPDPSNPTVFAQAPDFDQNLQNEALSFLGYSQDTAGNNGGLVPKRSVNVGAYTDGQVSKYATLDGSLLNYGTKFTLLTAAQQAANDIQGDFDGDDTRDFDDIALIVDALNGNTAGLNQNIALDLLGDFNGDGNFTPEDARYFADGLYINGSGNLDRAAAFAEIDNADGGNFFGTSLSTGETYAAGDSVADIAGNSTTKLSKTYGAVAGYAPVGADGVVNAVDVNYVYDNFGDFSVLAEAAVMDLSADMNGDLIVDIDDVKAVVNDVLDALPGDVNLDGTVNIGDLTILAGSFGSSGRWTTGDVSFDGTVNIGDLTLLAGSFGQTGTATGAVAVPEPAALALLAVGGLALIRHR